MLRTGKEDIGTRLRLRLDVSNNPMVAIRLRIGDRHQAQLGNLYNRPGEPAP